MNAVNTNLLLYKGAVCINTFTNDKYQVFYTGACNAVYVKQEKKVYELTIDAWTKLVLKLETILNKN